MIKFRAWDKVAKVMIYHIEQTYDGLGDFQENENIEDYVSDISFGCFADWLENDQFVIMQSTGLFDKNGVEIFDGDVVRIGTLETTPIGAVEFDKSNACFIIPNNKKYVFGGEYVTRFHAKYFEVVGNIYENHDLLESVEE
ncbi:YopX family protein [Streptococcus uberis]|uniref:YopX family protein n=1 Tax=Streptococcus uberis TaxID=1349 RepID=UPI0020C07829|nr:YopX family protein [Streptococcus uberis]